MSESLNSDITTDTIAIPKHTAHTNINKTEKKSEAEQDLTPCCRTIPGHKNMWTSHIRCIFTLGSKTLDSRGHGRRYSQSDRGPNLGNTLYFSFLHLDFEYESAP